MDVSSLARDLANLENSWSSLDWWLNFWTIIVVVGVGVELLVIITEYAQGWQDFKRGTIHSPDKPSILIFGLGFLGAALVAIGVAGELRIHVKAGKIEADMRDKTRQLVALVEGEAANANAEAARLQLENSKIIAALRQPTLSDADQKTIADKVRSCAKSDIRVIVEFGIGSKDLGFPIFNALKKGGFDRAEPRVSDSVRRGTSIKGPRELADVTRCISEALGSAKVTIVGLIGVSEPPGSPITISAGEKPLGELPK